MSLRSIAIAVTLPACLLKPSPPSGEGASDAGTTDTRMIDSRPIDGAASDGGGSGINSDAGTGSDGSGSDGIIPMWPYLLSVAYHSSAASSTGTSGSGYELDATGVHDNDVLLLIGNIDNGATDAISVPPGFTKLFDDYYSSGDGQTYFAAWKVADGEPPSYQGTYSSVTGDQYSAFALISIAGADTTMPIDVHDDYVGSAVEIATLPVQVTGSADMTAVADETVVVAGGMDWLGSAGMVADATPTAITLVAEVTDEGNNKNPMERTSLTVGWFMPAPLAGPLGSNSLTLTSGNSGVPWGIVIAVKPAP